MNTVTITLRNAGLSAVDASLIETSDPARFTTGTAVPAIIPPGGTATLDVNFLADTEPGLHTGFLIIRAGNFMIPLTARTLGDPEIILESPLDQSLEIRLITDDVAEWFEVGFLSPFETLPGSAADGWTDPDGYLLFRLERSEDLLAWDHAWSDSPLSPEPQGENWMIWARSEFPRLWKYVTIDITLTSDRHGKDITALVLFGTTIALPNYPYSMPADAAQLQTDLLALGYTGATVTNVAAPLRVEVINHLNTGQQTFPVTLSGSNVTQVKNAGGSTISLPGYPYAIPAQVSNLKSHLLAAGFPYIGVRAYDDEWTIFIPNRDTLFANRALVAAINPADPHTYNGMGGDGTDPGDLLHGVADNLRATTGLTPLEEAPKQFARLGISRGPNYLYP